MGNFKLQSSDLLTSKKDKAGNIYKLTNYKRHSFDFGCSLKMVDTWNIFKKFAIQARKFTVYLSDLAVHLRTHNENCMHIKKYKY